MIDWQPISTAPKDGQPALLLFDPKTGIRRGYYSQRQVWRTQEGCPVGEGSEATWVTFYPMDIQPTHWSELNEPTGAHW